MRNAAAALLALLAMTIGNAQEQTEPTRPSGPAAATEAKAKRDTATDTDRPTWIDPTRASTITKETPPTPPKACF